MMEGKKSQFWKPGSSLSNEKSPKHPENQSKTSLSKAVMSMKFMVKKGEEVAVRQEERAQKRKLAAADWSLEDKKQSDHASPSFQLVCTEETTDLFHSALPGRRSFGGFHAFLEQHYREHLDSTRLDGKLSGKSKGADSSVVNDEEMLERFDSLIGLPRGPNQGRMTSYVGKSSQNQPNRQHQHKKHKKKA